MTFPLSSWVVFVFLTCHLSVKYSFACDINPCMNGGICTMYDNIQQCNCAPGFDGYYCGNVACDTSPCQNGGTCTMSGSVQLCTCAPGFDGVYCGNNIDECLSNPCNFNGVCLNSINIYYCDCYNTHEGKNCEIEIDDCVSAMCQNDGTCVDGINEYTCTCAAGYEGIDCETDIDECASNPCTPNGGTCINNIDAYYCDCYYTHEGINCEIDVDFCDSNPCLNNGSCTDHPFGFTCTCPDGIQGIDCETNIDDCVSGLCQNDGTCVDGINEYSCTCATGYEGIDCETDIDYCESNLCENGASCTDFIDRYECVCPDGFEGLHCKTNTDECQSNPCLNGGSCSDLVNAYMCECAAGYIGRDCEIIVVCNPDNSIDLWNLPADYNYFAMQNITSDDDIKCTVLKPNSTSISITGCSKDSDILLTYGSYDGMEDNRIHGGKTMVAVTIRCNEIPDGGNIHAVDNALVASLDIDRETDVNPTYSVTSSLDPSTTTVGSPVIWTISLPSEYILEVSSCTAFRGTDDSSSTQIDLISAGGCVVREELIGNFTDNLDGTVSASIYAFRFYDESNVFLKCNVVVCPDVNTCDTTCSKAKRSIPSRISRSSRENKVAIVHNILHVMDEYSTATMTVPGVTIPFLLIVGAILT